MNKITKNYLYNLFYQVLTLVIPLLTGPYISRVLGPTGIGAYAFTNSNTQYFILFGCIGLSLYGQREIAYVQHEKETRDRIFWELVALRICTVSVSLLIFWRTLIINGAYPRMYRIMCLDILAAMFDISWFFQGIEDFRKIILRNVVIRLLSVVLIFTCVKSSEDLYIYVLCGCGTLLLGNLSMWGYLPKYVSGVPLRKLRIVKHVKPTLVLFFPQIATSLYTVFDKTMIGLLADVDEVAYYSQGQTIVKMVMALVTSLGTVMMPRIANLFKQNDFPKIKEYIGKSFDFVFFLSFPMMFGLVATSCSIVPWFFGPGYDKVIPNMMVIAPILVMVALSNVIGTQYLLPIGRQKQFTISLLAGCGTNCVMNLLLIPLFSSIGAAIATVIAETSVTVVQVAFTWKELNYRQILRDNIKCVVSAGIMFVPVFLLASKLSSTILHSCLCVAVGAVIYACLLLLMKDKHIFEAINTIQNRRKIT